MGNSEISMQQNSIKEPIIEFLYKDSALIDSLYAQLFKGNVARILQTVTTSESQNKSIGTDIKLFKGDMGSTEVNSDAQQEDIDPHDMKVAELIQRIEPEHLESFDEAKDGDIVAVQGRISLLCKQYIKDLMSPLENAGILDQLYQMKTGLDKLWLQGQNKGKASPVSMKTLMATLVDLLPNGISGSIESNSNEIALIFKNDGFTSDPEAMVQVIGSTIPGEYVCLGIFDKKNSFDFENFGEEMADRNFAKSINIFQEAPVSLLSRTANSWFITPIVIYRNLYY